MLKKLFAISFSLLITSPVLADDITLDADNSVEYHQKEQKLVAKGNAVAQKKDMSISRN